jgi:hypothetical protein
VVVVPPVDIPKGGPRVTCLDSLRNHHHILNTYE